MFRRLVCIVLSGAFVALVCAPSPAAAAPGSGSPWQPPVTGALVRRFEPPAHAYGAGHLGVDYAAAPGTPVRAAGPGVVAFAGVVGGAVHVVVAHAGGLRTSYSFLVSASVHRGERVATGAIIGRAGGAGEQHDGTVVHFGLRSGSTYLDPLLLFRPPDLAKVVHLAPHRDPLIDSVTNERRGLLAGIAHGVRAVIGSVGAVDRQLLHLTRSATAHITKLALEGAVVELGNLLDHLSLAPSPSDALRIARRLVAWAQSLRTCDPHAPPADGTGGSGNRVMLVAGINSSLGLGDPGLNLPAERLGYARGDIASFSYTDTGGAYGPLDTHEPIERAARQLRDQLRAMQHAAPGRKVDLIAHSQGGIVVLAFVLLYYRTGDPTLPPLGSVITLSSPIRGAPGATAASLLGQTSAGRALLAHLRFRASSLRDLAEGSELLRAIDAARLPDQLELTTVGNADDYVVPGSNAHLRGANTFDVDSRSLTPHSTMLRDGRTLQVLRAALEHRALPCQSFGEALRAATVPTSITRIEHLGVLSPRQ